MQQRRRQLPHAARGLHLGGVQQGHVHQRDRRVRVHPGGGAYHDRAGRGRLHREYELHGGQVRPALGLRLSHEQVRRERAHAVARPRTGQAQDPRERRGPGRHPHRHGGRAARLGHQAAHRVHPARPHGRARGHRLCLSVPGQRYVQLRVGRRASRRRPVAPGSTSQSHTERPPSFKGRRPFSCICSSKHPHKQYSAFYASCLFS